MIYWVQEKSGGCSVEQPPDKIRVPVQERKSELVSGLQRQAALPGLYPSAHPLSGFPTRFAPECAPAVRPKAASIESP